VRRLTTYLILSIVIPLAALAATIASGNQPVLGLDLQGGVSVVLAPVGEYNPDSLDVAVDIIRNRVDGLGVAEPEISRQGNNIVVDLPGVKDREKARRVVGQTAELRFRPVLAELPPEGTPTTTTTTSTTTSTPGSTVPGQPTTTAAPTTTTTTTTTTVPPDQQAILAAVAACDATQVAALAQTTEIPTTARANDKRDACVVLPSRSEDEPRLFLGPVNPKKVNDERGLSMPRGLTGDDVDSGDSRFVQGEGYTVDLELKDSGQEKFNALAGVSFAKPPPQNRVAIVLDGIVQSSPQFNDSSFPDNTVQISGNFTPEEAEDLATVINYGALPVQLKQLTVENVSPTLGQDQLDAGIAAAIIGLALVATYMVVYYRLLGLVVIVGILLTAALTWSVISYMGEAVGLTLTLAGVTGLIVSVGITVDSYVVYFERLKDEVRAGRTVRSSVDRAFVQSFRTIVAADLVSLIGAAVLYFLAIGQVRGFAFYLGLSTLLDLIIGYFFMHPAVSLMSRKPALVRMRNVGIAAGLDAPGVTA
jgi:preprotein translocase subunit SecD